MHGPFVASSAVGRAGGTEADMTGTVRAVDTVTRIIQRARSRNYAV